MQSMSRRFSSGGSGHAVEPIGVAELRGEIDVFFRRRSAVVVPVPRLIALDPSRS